MANQYSVNPLGGFNPAQHMDNLTAQNKAEAKDAEALQGQRDQKMAFQKALSGKPEDMEALAGVSPQMFQWMDKRQQKREQTEGVAVAQLKENTERDWLVRYREALNSGDENSRTQLIQEAVDDDNNDLEHGSIGKDTEMDKSVVNMALFRSLGKDGYKNLYGGGDGGVNIGAASPKDFTVESLAQYENTGNIGDLNRYSPKTLKVGGVEHQLNPETQRWEPIIDATAKNVSVQARALADIEADKKSRLDFAVSKTKWGTGRPKFRSKINSAKASQSILQATSDQIKKHVNGLTTKYGASLASIPGSEARLLKNQLNTLKAHSAFSTLTDLKQSGGTLGAISEAELVLLESKLGALDQGGDSSELIRVIEQIVNSNLSSISRLETEFNATDSMYSGSFDDFQSGQAPLSDEDLLLKYGG